MPREFIFLLGKQYGERSLTSFKREEDPWQIGFFLCRRNEENIIHILLHCIKTRVLWELLFFFFVVAWIFPSSIGQALERLNCALKMVLQLGVQGEIGVSVQFSSAAWRFGRGV